MGISKATVHREWRTARAALIESWLLQSGLTNRWRAGMTPARWEEVKQVLHEAWERGARRPPRVSRSSCTDDPSAV